MEAVRRPRITVAFGSVETPQDRLFYEAFTGEIVSDERRRRPPWKGTFWCAADKPIEDPSLVLRPVYRTTKLPNDEDGFPFRCNACGIEIVELQRVMSEWFG